MTGWVVVCEDGETRHHRPFATRWGAEFWANWGHICTTRHEYRTIEIHDQETAA